jgi:hypothetical protein
MARLFRDNSHVYEIDGIVLLGRSGSDFGSVNEFRKLQRKKCRNCIEKLERWITAHLSLSNMANVVTKAIGEFLLGQLLRLAQFRELGSNRLGQCVGLSFLVGTDSFGHSPSSFA